MEGIFFIMLLAGIPIFLAMAARKKMKEFENQANDSTPYVFEKEPKYSHPNERREYKPIPLPDQDCQSRKKKESAKNIPPPPPELPDTQEPEFSIRSIEEVRKGIIWSEILNRKY